MATHRAPSLVLYCGISCCCFSAFADDLLLLVELQSRAYLEREGAALMAIVESWGRSVGLEVNKNKTCVMMLKRGIFQKQKVHCQSW